MYTELKQLLKNQFIFLDGGTGSVLQKEGLLPGEQPENWNITKPQAVISLHKKYFFSGSNIIVTNTFGANRFKFGSKTEQIINAAVKNAKQAIKEVEENNNVGTENIIRVKSFDPCKAPHFIALDIGPSGKLLKPLGDLDFEDAVSLFKEVALIGIKAGVDLIFIETMSDCYETKACILGVKEAIVELTDTISRVQEIPIFVSNVYDGDGRLLSGSSVTEMTSLLEGLGVDALGMNCGLGPVQMEKIVPSMVNESSTPIIVKPNAGLPRVENDVTIYDISAKEFASYMTKIASQGATILGGCCGTTPEYIRMTVEAVFPLQFNKISVKNFCVVSSGTKSVKIGQSELYGRNHPVLIGERLNPTGKKKLKEALHENNMQYIINEAITQETNGAEILDVNVGLPDIDETKMMVSCIKEIQSVTDLPLQIDTSNIETMEKALRIYNGKALINSLNGKQEVMEKVFPLVKKYGGVVVALTLDEEGIPSTYEGRMSIVKKIYKTAEMYGVSKKNILIDPLAMAVSSDSNAPTISLNTIRSVSESLDGNTIMGVSNISFGLPSREIITSVFFTMAMECGLSAAIMNPSSEEMKKSWYSFCTLRGFDKNCLEYINFAQKLVVQPKDNFILKETETKKNISISNTQIDYPEDSLEYAIIKGLKKAAVEQTIILAKTMPLMEIIEKKLIPSLDYVGKAFESKKIYLPQLLMSADTVACSFDIIKNIFKQSGTHHESKGKIILATVQGDIHDIGKNIVKVILENYGYDIIDLGKDVSPEKIVECCVCEKIRLVGLSALMTTTVPAMEKTIKLLKEKAPWAKTIVGGAVLTSDYAKQIGADHYSKDAMETASYANKIFGKK